MADWGRECLKLAEAPLPIEAIPVPGTADAAMLRQLERAEEAGFEVGQAARELLLAEAPQVQPFVVLAGGDGAGKTYHLRELVRQVAEDSLGGHTGRTFLPLLLDLATHLGDRSGAALAHGAGVERLLFDALGRFWTGLEPLRFRELWQSPDGPTLVVLIHNINILADAERATLFRELAELAARERRHRFLVACNPSWLHQERGAELPVSEYLVVKRLSFQRVTGYLSALPDTAGQVLLTALEKRRLYDLAGLPWLLVHMLNRTRLGDPPRSRMGVLAGFVGGALADLPSGGAVRGRARESLRALAYALQMVRCRTLPLERVLEILESVRGMREYRLIDMLESLVESRLLVLVGQDGVQFSYPALQAYCCADAMLAAPDSNALLEDIAATLGWLSRLRWWADTLVLLAGMTDAIEVLVGFILHGAGAGQEERVFLAARCIEENGAVDSSSHLFEQTVTALLYLANADYEPRQRVRTRAVHAIQRLQVRSAIPHLVRIAIEPVRTNWIGKRAEEYSGVRLAAMMALRSMGDATLQYVGDRLPVLAELLRRWIAGDASAIERHLSHGDDRVRPVAAFLLGLLRRPEADDHLIALFRSPDQGQLVSWAVTDALTLVDPARVAKEVILPFVDPATGVPVDLPGESQRPRRDRRRQLAYLIGKMKPRDTWAERYLDHCIESLPDIALKGYAVRAFGDRLDTRAKPLLERLALGDFSGIASDASWSDEDRLWLRQESVEALAQVGDSETVRRLRSEWPGSPVTATDAQPQSESAQRLKQEARRKLELNLELARFRTSEEIASRAWEADLDVGD
jgi:HEAT repeat protein